MGLLAPNRQARIVLILATILLMPAPLTAAPASPRFGEATEILVHLAVDPAWRPPVRQAIAAYQALGYPLVEAPRPAACAEHAAAITICTAAVAATWQGVSLPTVEACLACTSVVITLNTSRYLGVTERNQAALVQLAQHELAHGLGWSHAEIGADGLPVRHATHTCTDPIPETLAQSTATC